MYRVNQSITVTMNLLPSSVAESLFSIGPNMSMATHANGLDVGMYCLPPAFLFGG